MLGVAVEDDPFAKPSPQSVPERIAQCAHAGHGRQVLGERAGLAQPRREQRALGAGAPPALVAGAVDQRLQPDAAQTVGKIPTKVEALGVDLLTIAGHKAYAPKGIGALYVRRGVTLEPLVHGAGHEGGRRAGTESALLAAGLGTACALAADLAPMSQVKALRDLLWTLLRERLGNRVVRNGDAERCLPNTLNVAFPGESGPTLLSRIDGLAASTGSACHSGQTEPSPVLNAMGVPREVALGAVRFSLGRATTRAEIVEAVERVAAVLGASAPARRVV